MQQCYKIVHWMEYKTMLIFNLMILYASPLTSNANEGLGEHEVASTSQASLRIRLDPESIFHYRNSFSNLLRNITTQACHKGLAKLHCPLGTEIQVLSVFYGNRFRNTDLCAQTPLKPQVRKSTRRTCRFESSFKIARSECDGKTSCHLWASPEQFSTRKLKDPCPTVSKYLIVRHRCQPQTLQGKLICADSYGELSCSKRNQPNNPMLMLIAHARTTNRIEYIDGVSSGKQDQPLQRCANTLSKMLVPCMEEDVSSFIRQSCQAQNSCTLLAAQRQHRLGQQTKSSSSALVLQCARQHLFLLYTCVSLTELAHHKDDVANQLLQVTVQPSNNLQGSQDLLLKPTMKNKEDLLEDNGTDDTLGVNDQSESHGLSGSGTDDSSLTKVTQGSIKSDGKADAVGSGSTRSGIKGSDDAKNIRKEQSHGRHKNIEPNLELPVEPKDSGDQRALAGRFLMIGGSIGATIVLMALLLKVLLVRYRHRQRLRAARIARITAASANDNKPALMSSGGYNKTELILPQTSSSSGPPVTCYPVPSAQILLAGCGPLTDTTSGSDRSSASLCHTAGSGSHGSIFLQQHQQRETSQQHLFSNSPQPPLSPSQESAASSGTGSTNSRVHYHLPIQCCSNMPFSSSSNELNNIRSQFSTHMVCTCSNCDCGGCICLPPSMPSILPVRPVRDSNLCRLKNSLQICTELVPEESEKLAASSFAQQ